VMFKNKCPPKEEEDSTSMVSTWPSQLH
jgi:hypothetical protein